MKTQTITLADLHEGDTVLIKDPFRRRLAKVVRLTPAGKLFVKFQLLSGGQPTAAWGQIREILVDEVLQVEVRI